MLYLKIGGGLMIVCCGILAGCYGADKLKQRLNFYEQYIRFLTQASAVINYTAADVRTLFEGMHGLPMIEPVLRMTLLRMEAGDDFSVAWKEAVRCFVRHKSDRCLLNYFGETFGTENCSGELAKLSLHRESAVRQHADLLEDYKTKRKLYRILGLFSGTLMALLLL